MPSRQRNVDLGMVEAVGPPTARPLMTQASQEHRSKSSTPIPAGTQRESHAQCHPLPARRRRLLRKPRRHRRRLMTDNGSAYRSRDFRQVCDQLDISSTSRDPITPRPTAKPSASSSPRCANGPTARPTSTRPNEPPPSMNGSTTTTGYRPHQGHRRRHTDLKTLVQDIQPLDASQLARYRTADG